MAKGTKEIHFEAHIEQELISVGFNALDTSHYKKELCLVPEYAIAFLKDSQPEKYQALVQQYGSDVDKRIAQNLATNIAKYGVLRIFRKGYKDRGQDLKWVWFKPNNKKNEDHYPLYQKNRFAIIRQLKYSEKNENSIDVVLFLNGIPIITSELKNALTGQYVTDAIKQYEKDRDPNEPLLRYKRCLVHMAVSTEKVFMTTRLEKDQTKWYPFNIGIENPVNLDGFKTEYLWKDLWAKDSLLELIQHYVHYQTIAEKYYDSKTKSIKESKKEVMIFPRYHQRRSVNRLLEAIRQDGVGTDYLIGHSAGSGKSNSISWLAHRLSSFYQHMDDENAMFHSVIVVTDRRVLDKQLQDNISQFEQVSGVVECIDEKKSSQDLKNAIEAGKRIIITTLQKFPVISSTIGHYQDRNYAVIIDEAHSSQSGESAKHLKKSLTLEQAKEIDQQAKTLDDIVLDEIEAKGKLPNLSFIAFTATPKHKTLELFGTTIDGEKRAFDEYSMEQAIKERFILDVLQSYTSFKRYYKLAISKGVIDEKEYETKKTVRLLKSWVDLQDHAIDLKARIMLEHFVANTEKEIQGKARAMLVTSSRLHAVRFKRKFDSIMREQNLKYKALVAFSGTVYDPETDEDYTEVSMNSLGGKVNIQDAFKLPQYRTLIVANKFQTGFDEPMLHTMFVDKKLGGVNTVQTLSRLNRMAEGKNSTMVLDFVNEPEQVKIDFQRYYVANFMDEDKQTDPNRLYDILNQLEDYQVYFENDIEEYAQVFFLESYQSEKLQPILDNCVNRFKELEDEQGDEFKVKVTEYVRLYRFLCQIITFKDPDLEKTHVFLAHLAKKLPKDRTSLPKEVLDEVELDSYKIQKQYTVALQLESIEGELSGSTTTGSSSKEEIYDLLANIIKTLNEAYGTNFTDEDKVEFDKIEKQIHANQKLMNYFNKSNSKDNIRKKFEEELDKTLLEFVNTKLGLFNKLTEEKTNATLKRMWFNDLYDRRVRGIER